jgi:hypothetical protein
VFGSAPPAEEENIITKVFQVPTFAIGLIIGRQVPTTDATDAADAPTTPDRLASAFPRVLP